MLKASLVFLFLNYLSVLSIPIAPSSKLPTNSFQPRVKRAFDRFDNSGVFYFGSARSKPPMIVDRERMAKFNNGFLEYIEEQSRHPTYELQFVLTDRLPEITTTTTTTTPEPTTESTTIEPSPTTVPKQTPTLIPPKEGDTELVFILTND